MDQEMKESQLPIEAHELELPDTTYIRDIESKVFQSIALQTLAKIEGVSLLGATLIDNLLGREGPERIKGIYVEQDQKKHSVYLRVEVNVSYGISIPQKAEEIQSKIVREISTLTGLHVSCVHVIFKNLILPFSKEEDSEEKEDSTDKEFASIVSEETEEGLGDGL